MLPEIVTALVISPLLQEALSRATSYAAGQIARAWNSEELEELKALEKELKKELTKIQSLLKVVEKMGESDDNIDDNIRAWLQDLEDLAYELVNILDEYDYAVNEQVRTSVPPSLSVQFLRRMAGKTKNIKESLNGEIKIIDALRAISGRLSGATRRQYDDNSETFRKQDLLEIEGLLTKGNREHPLFGLSIVGMPGVGKTTLARSIEKWAKDGGIYRLVAWVSVPRIFDEVEIFGVMYEYLTGNRLSNPDALLDKLKELLTNQNFLLILDDFSVELAEKTWGNFIRRLSSDFNTSRKSIVVTTSNKKVASMMDAVGRKRDREIHMLEYEVQKLSNDECWSIIEKKVLRSSELTSIEDPLLAIGKAIAAQCGGLPLVADVIGEALSQRVDADEWSAIRDNTAWDSPYRIEILSKLKKSFDRLSSPLKKCFSYCSIFPKGYEIRKDELVQLWMAKGFLCPDDDSKSDKQEDVGDKYLNDLVSNFLFQDVKMDEYGNIESCKMHDEVHNLSLSLSKYETYISSDTRPIEECSRIRHLRVESNTNFSAVRKDVPQRLHSLFLDVDVFHTMASNLSSLRTLKLAAADIEELEASLGNLKYYIKYLDISKIDIQGLPDSVTKLYNLQTLRVTGCQSLTGIENLVSLRHIYFDDERHMPSSIGKLTSLQTLPLFVVGEQEGRRIEELKCLSQLRGKLKICNLEKVSESEATEAKLEEKVQLIELQFVWSKSRASSNNDKSVLEGLRPHSNLKSLTFENYRGSDFPLWMVKDVSGSVDSFRLNNLVNLKLSDCDECCNISSLGLLPKLKDLHISAMSKVERIGSAFYHNSNMASSSQAGGQLITLFPALRSLSLQDMTKLEEWTEEQGLVVFPCLEELLISDCPVFKTWCIDGSASHKLSVLSILTCPKLQVIPSGMRNSKSLSIHGCPNLKRYA